MVSFRRCILALAVLALFVGLASAQVGTAGTSVYGTGFTCSANVAVPPQLRAEGVTELIGDIVLTCTGSTPVPVAGGLVQTANVTVSLGTNVTSRILNSSNVSEALLLVDEPGSGLAGPGPAATQAACSVPTAGAGPGGCIGTATGVLGLYYNAATGNAGVCSSINSSGLCAAFSAGPPNVYQGVVANGNQVVFNGIPIVAPVTSGFSRIFRITNVRANAAGVGSLGLAGTTPLNASVAISGSSSVPVNQPVLIAGFIQNGLATSVRNNGDSGTLSSTSGNSPLSFLQCNSQNTSGSSGLNQQGIAAFLRFSENFATAFKTRVAPNPTAGTTGLFSGPTFAQNIPGTIYNSESGFILNSGSGFTGTVQPGLADWGTRLRAVFSNIPSGVSVFVSTTNVANFGSLGNGTFGGNNGVGNTTLPVTTASIAELIQSETAPDFNNQAPIINPTNTLAITNPSNLLFTGSTPPASVAQVPLTNGAGEAVWEVVSANPNIQENFDFALWFVFSANPGGGSPALGSGKVNLSFAPAPGLPGTAPSSSYTAASSGPIPRFVDNSTAATLITTNICQTDLLYPFVTNENGFETGMSIANTSTDPFGTSAQNGSCIIQFYGDNAPATNTTTTAPCTTAGACTGAINSGKVFANTLSGIIGSGSSFQGYAIAVCNFQFAHGFAFISDTHATNLAMGYLALIMNNGSNISRGAIGENLNN